jgi:hypothetical protein
VRSARDRRSTARTWLGTPIKNNPLCIFPEKDICRGGAETGSIGKAATAVSPAASASRKAKPMRPRSVGTLPMSAANRKAQAAPNASNAERHHPSMAPERILADHGPGWMDIGLEDVQRRQREDRQRR